MTYSTITLNQDKTVCLITMGRLRPGSTIDRELVLDFETALKECEPGSNIVVLEGDEEVFCAGLDFSEVCKHPPIAEAADLSRTPERLYEIWKTLAAGPFISIAHVRGKVNAGGVGFAAACDLVIANPGATFCLSELLFGLTPACVLPFLIKRVGWQRARYMTLSTRTVGSAEAKEWGLVDAVDQNSAASLRSYLPRLRRLPKEWIRDCKAYLNGLSDFIDRSKGVAVEANQRMFADPRKRACIAEFLRTGRFGWEKP